MDWEAAVGIKTITFEGEEAYSGWVFLFWGDFFTCQALLFIRQLLYL